MSCNIVVSKKIGPNLSNDDASKFFFAQTAEITIEKKTEQNFNISIQNLRLAQID